MTAQAGAPQRAGAAAGGQEGVPQLARGRVHELCGPSRRTLALLLAGHAAGNGPVIWIAPAWRAERLHAPGMAPLLDPARLILVDCARAEDLLWCAEEALRRMAEAGGGAVVVVELPSPPGLTPVRRLHLAAGGRGAGAAALTPVMRGALSAGPPLHTGRPDGPLGLLLTPGAGGAPGIESRWHMRPCHAAGRAAWRLWRRRARAAPPAAWLLTEGDDGQLRGHAAPLPDAAPG